MVWIWAFVSGLPIGVLGFLALEDAPLSWLPACAGAGGLAVASAAELAARFGSHAPDRGRHIAQAVSIGWAGWPAGLAAWLSLAPGAAASFAALSGIVALLLVRASRTGSPGAGVGRQLAAVFLALSVGTCGFAGWAGLVVSWRGRADDSPPPESRSRYVYDLDAQITTRPIPVCDRAVQVVRTIARGARPAVASDGALWFDAPGPEGRRQIWRRDLATPLEAECFTCGQPGNNLRPVPSSVGQQVVFETDRHAGPLRPIDRELYLLTASGPPPAVRLQRLTQGRGADRWGRMGPGGQALVWSTQERGSWAVVTAALEYGHGGISVGSPNVLATGGSGWIAPLAWSADARTLAVLRGGPRRLGHAELLDPATGETHALELSGAHVAGVAFSSDGGFLAVVSTRPDAWARTIPGNLGFLAAPLELLAGPQAVSPLQDTALHVGETRAALRRMALGESGSWGYPTGVALSADGTHAYVGQRERRRAAPVQERILELDLCS